MLKNMLNYSGLITKIRSMESNLIRKDSFIALAALPDVDSFVNFLKEHPVYRSVFEDAKDQSFHRGDIEALLINSKYNQYAKLYRFASIDQRAFMDVYFVRFEIDLLKTCFRMVFDERNASYNLSVFQSFFDTHSKIKIKALSQVETLEDLLSQLSQTKYHRLLSPLYDQGGSLFEYENALDTYYYSYYWKHINKSLKGLEKKIITEQIGVQIDLHNIVSLYRSKTYFQIEGPHLYSFLIPVSYKLKQTDVTRLIEAEDRAAYMDVINSTYYKRYQTLQGKHIEITAAQIINYIYRSHMKKYPYSIASVSNYLHEKDREISLLTTALECIRYQLPYEQTIHYLETEVSKS